MRVHFDGGRGGIAFVKQLDDIGIFLLSEHWPFLHDTIKDFLRKESRSRIVVGKTDKS